MSIYVICSLFSFSLVGLLNFLGEKVAILGLITAPIIFTILAFLVQKFSLNKFLTLSILTIVFLLMKSELIILYFEACDISNNHNFLTGTISLLCIATTIFMVYKILKSKLSKIDLGLIVLSILIFEVASRIEYLSLLSFLYSL